MKDRVKWLDYANVLAMLAVVWFHVPSAAEAQIRHLEYITVNIPFFLLSGYVFALAGKDKRNTKDFLKHLCKSLLVPTCFFYAFFYVLWLVAGRRLAGDAELWNVPLQEFIQGQFNVVLATYWFVISLFVMNLLYYALSKSQSHLLVALACGLMPVISLYCPLPGLFRLREAMLFIPFFAIGAGLYRLREHRTAYADIALCLLCLAVYCLISHHTDTAYYRWYEMLSGLALCAVVYLVAKACSGYSRADRFVGTLRYGALVLLATQNYIIGCAKVLFDISDIRLKPLVIISVYAITYPIILLIRKKMPFILGKW